MTLRGGSLRRQLGLSAVVAVVMGDVIGSGIFFTPGELAQVADHPWQVYFIWALSGLIVLCGALTLGELTSLLPRAGSSYHIIDQAFGSFWAFVKAWIEVIVSAPGSIAGIAIVFGEYAIRLQGADAVGSPALWGIGAIILFATINLMGVRWGGTTQIILTTVKIAGILLLVLGSLFLAAPAATPALTGAASSSLFDLLRFVGLGVAAVFFTFDGWVDVSHVAGEVDNPRTSLPRGLAYGVTAVMLLYLLVNFAFLRVVPLPVMREEGATVATAVAMATFGELGGSVVTGLIMVSIFGALGGLVMTAPRIVFAPAEDYANRAGEIRGGAVFRALCYVSPQTGAPSAAILFCTMLSIIALVFFGTFGRLVSFIFVPIQFMNILLVGAVFRLRKRTRAREGQYLTPGYPFVPLIFMFVMTLLILSAVWFSRTDSLIGIGMTALCIPFFLMLQKRRGARP